MTRTLASDHASLWDRVGAIGAEFQGKDDWNDKLRTLMSFAERLPEREGLRCDKNRFAGCQSQVWLELGRDPNTGRVRVAADSDARIVRGLLAIVIDIYDDRKPEEIVAVGSDELTSMLPLDEIAPGRSSGFGAVMREVRSYAQDAGADE